MPRELVVRTGNARAGVGGGVSGELPSLSFVQFTHCVRTHYSSAQFYREMSIYCERFKPGEHAGPAAKRRRVDDTTYRFSARVGPDETTHMSVLFRVRSDDSSSALTPNYCVTVEEPADVKFGFYDGIR